MLVLRSESWQVNTGPLRSRFMQRWSFVHVASCAGGGRFQKTHLVCCSFTAARHHVVIWNAVVPTEFAPSPDYHISIGNILDKIISPRYQPTCRIAMLSLSRSASDTGR